MSKHIFEQTLEDQTYEVQIGWDKPLQNFYCVISPWVEDADYKKGGYFDDPDFSNLFLGNKMTLDEIANECQIRGFSIPNGLLENVMDDQRRNAVNEIKIYNTENAPMDKPNPPSSPGF